MNSEPLKGCETLPPMVTPGETTRKGDKAGNTTTAKQRAGKRFAMFNTFVDCTLATLLRTDALVWLVLFRDARGDTAKSEQGYIARRAGVCPRTVKTAIKRLKLAGLLDVVYQGGLNRGISIYRIHPLSQDADRGKPIAP